VRLFKGMLVELPGRRGIGKLDSVIKDQCVVSVFHSLLHSELVEFSVNEIARAYLSPQTRVYVEKDGRFRVGRVTHYLIHDNGLVAYEVRFPNGHQADLNKTKLFVRPWNAPKDPSEVPAGGRRGKPISL
jgi:ATP-dependent helicase HepA